MPKRTDFLKQQLAIKTDGITLYYQLHPRDPAFGEIVKAKGKRVQRPRKK